MSYVSVEIVDEKGHVVPYVEDLEITYKFVGDATIAGVGNGDLGDMSGFQQNHKKVSRGRGLIIIRPNGSKGVITLKATGTGLKDGVIQINTK